MAGSIGDAAQTRAIVDQAAKASAELAVRQFVAEHPDLSPPKTEIPGPLKWAAGIVSALLAMGVGGTVVWLMTTVNEMQVTIARIDERMASAAVSAVSRDDEINRRLTRLELLASESSE